MCISKGNFSFKGKGVNGFVYFILTANTQVRLPCTRRTSSVFIEKDVLGLWAGMLFFTGSFYLAARLKIFI